MSPRDLPSIRQRLSRALGSIALVWALGMTTGVGLLTHHLLDDLLDGALRESAEILYGLVALAGRDGGQAHDGMLPAPPHQENLVWQLVDLRGTVVLRSHKAPEARLTERQTDGFTSDALGEWHVFSLPMRDGRNTLHVAQREDSRRATLWLAMGACMGLTLLLGLGAAWWLNRGLRRELQPLLDLSNEVATLEPLHPHNPGLTATRTELQPLVAAIDGLTQRLAQRVAHERALAAHAAHALRTPLAGMDAQLAVALKEAPPALQPRLAQTREAAARLRRVVTALITLFRSGGELHWQHTSVPALLQRLPLQETLVQASGHDTVPCDPDLLSAALSNLLDNAVRHGARLIRVHAEVAHGQVRLTLRDNGSGIPEGQRLRLQAALDTQALDGGRGLQGLQGLGTEMGLGLGLTLADMVARTHGGRLRLLTSGMTGASVVDADVVDADAADAEMPGAAIELHWPAQAVAPEPS
jgi:signal transduction histidine kinase